MRKFLSRSSLFLFAGWFLAEPAGARIDLLESPRFQTPYSEEPVPKDSVGVQSRHPSGWIVAANIEPTACGIVTSSDAQKLVGGALDVQEFAKIPGANGAGAYDSVCTYIAKGGSFQDPVGSSRFLDATLHFLNSADEMKTVYEDSLGQYRDMAKAPDAPFKNALITPLTGFGDKAFVVEAVTDPKTNYKSALIVFYKGRVGGTVSAWKKPESSLETTKAVLRHILSKLP